MLAKDKSVNAISAIYKIIAISNQCLKINEEIENNFLLALDIIVYIVLFCKLPYPLFSIDLKGTLEI